MARQEPRRPRARADAPAAGRRASRGIDLIWIYPHLVCNVHARPRWRAHPQRLARSAGRPDGGRRQLSRGAMVPERPVGADACTHTQGANHPIATRTTASLC